MIGKVLSNRYELISELGSGGMAWVYLAEDLRTQKQVAVKILYPQLSQDIGFVQRFTQEAKLAMSLSQAEPESHIARILDYGSDRDTHYLVMEYVEGRDLRQLIEEEGPLPWKQALDIARQIALALGHAHQHGIVHRDIKPGNAMLLSDGSVRVLDFGVARARTSPALTQSGFVGSPYYVAPEQAMGQSVDIRADIYSLGVVLYEMLTCELPFDSDTPWGIINHHIATPPPALEEVRPELPRSISRLVRKSMSKRPEDRFQTPAAMVQAIEAILSGLEIPSESPDADPDVLAPLLAGLYQRGLQAIEEQNWQEAVDLFSQILKLDPRYQDVTDRLAEAGRQARLAALYSAAARARKEGRWSEAMGELDEIAEMDPHYRDVQDLRETVQQMQATDLLYRQGLKHVEAQEWAAAIECLEQVSDREPDYGRTQELLEAARAEQKKSMRGIAPAVAEEAPTPPPAPRRRNWLWGVVAVLVLALAVESYLFYRAQQHQLSGVSTPPVATQTQTPPTLGPTRTPHPATAESDETPAQPAVTRPTQSTSSSEPTVTHTPTPTPTLDPALAVTAVPEPALAGQIAFPRFDPARGTYDVHICRADGSACRRVAQEASQPNLLPDGSKLVLHSWKLDERGLILQSVSGERIWRITDDIEAARPSVDFDGKVYVYHSRQEVDRQSRLFRTYEAETRPIERDATAVLGQSPSWLPDGRILYSGCVGDACGIIAMNRDGSNPRQVVAGGTETNPEASPDGRQVAFMSQRDGNWEVYVANLDGSDLQRLTRDPANDGLPAWSPDGRLIAFVSDRDGAWAVWVMRPDGSGQRRLFNLGGPLGGQVKNTAPHENHGWAEERISWSPLP